MNVTLIHPISNFTGNVNFQDGAAILGFTAGTCSVDLDPKFFNAVSAYGIAITIGTPGPAPAYDANMDVVTAAIVGAPGSQTTGALKAAYGSLLNQRVFPRVKTLPALMSSPPTITFTGVGNPASSITSAQFLSAVNVPYPGAATALSANFAYRYGIAQQDNTYYARPKQPTLSAGLPLRVCGWFYGTKIEFAYRGQGDLSSRLWVDGDYAEAVYTADTVQDGAPHLRAFTFATAAWRYLEFESSTSFYGINIGPVDAWLPGAPPNSDKLLVIGDSYGGGTGATTAFTGYTYQLGRMLGFDDVYSYSFGGTGVLSVNGSNPKYRDRAADWTPTGATAALIQHSINDDSFTTTQINTELALLVPAVRAALPNLKYLWIQGPAPRGGGDVSSKQTRDAALAAQAAALGVPHISLVTAPAPWTGTGKVGATTGSGSSDVLMSGDGAHPTQAGHDVIARLGAYRYAALRSGS